MNSAPQPRSFDPDRPDYAPYGLSCVHWWPSPMRRPDHHNEIELNLLVSGAVTYLLGGNKTVVPAGRLSIFWAAIPHQIIDYSDDTEYFVATVPLQNFLHWRLPDNLVQPLMQGQFLSEATDENAEADAQLFEHWEQDLAAEGAQFEEPVLLEMQARLLRFAVAMPAVVNSGGSRDGFAAITDSGLNKVEQMACFIAQHYTEKLTSQQIGDFVNLHPNYAMNLFRKSFGMTLTDYITQHRVSHAQRLLSTTDQTATDIALRSGFMSMSRFNEAFRRACNCSPSEYRRSHELQKSVAGGFKAAH